MSQNQSSGFRSVFARWGWLPLIAGLVVILDQSSKAWIERNIPLGGFYAPIPALDPYFMFVHWGNTGSAFGLFQGLGGFFAVIALVVIVSVLLFAQQLPLDNWGVRLGVGLILGGAISNNLIDRVRLGHVTDFLLFQVPVGGRMYQWPAWNVADGSIVVGVILVGFLLLRSEVKEPDAPAT